MADNKPLVSIGMPVYNGERFIRQALDSLLAQDYANFELIISDNASADRTQDICEGYAKSDPRIRYYRNEENIGPLNNFKKVFKVAQGQYFMWAAHDDMWHPSYVRELVKLLSDNPSAVVAMSDGEIISEQGSFVSTFSSTFSPFFESTLGKGRAQRLAYFFDNCWAYLVYGVYKRNELARALTFFDGMADHWNVDFVVPIRCIQEGDAILSSLRMFYKRIGHRSLARIHAERSPWRGAFDPMRSYVLALQCIDWSKLHTSERLYLYTAFAIVTVRKQSSSYYRRAFLSVFRRKMRALVRE